MMPCRAFLVFLAMALPAQGIQSQRLVEILIPKAMPIKIDARRDYTDSQIVKYVITRKVPKNTIRAKITTVMIDENGTIKLMRSIVGDHLDDPMSIATADMSVARILLIVEWLETEKGKWVMDTQTQKLDTESLIKRGAKALPGSKFVLNE